jgi:hypothetical protein
MYMQSNQTLQLAEMGTVEKLLVLQIHSWQGIAVQQWPSKTF